MTQADLAAFHMEHFGDLGWNRNRKEFPMPIHFDYPYRRTLTKRERRQRERYRLEEHKRQYPLFYDHYGKRKP